MCYNLQRFAFVGLLYINIYGQEKRHAHIYWPVCCIHIYPRQGARAHGMCMLSFMMTPEETKFLSLLIIVAQGCPGPFWAPFLARTLCTAALVCFVHDAPAGVSKHHYIQTLSPAQLQPVTSACVPARPACAWTLRFSPLLLFTFHKAVSICLLQVLLNIHTSRRA